MDDGGPAFPTVPVNHGYEPSMAGHGTGSGPGLSLRDYFAAKAPEAPEWFTHAPLPKKYAPKPKYWNLPESCRDIAASWAEDPCYDLIGYHLNGLTGEELSTLKTFVDSWDDHCKGHNEWIESDKMARLAQWSYHWADAMLAARTAPSPATET